MEEDGAVLLLLGVPGGSVLGSALQESYDPTEKRPENSGCEEKEGKNCPPLLCLK